MGSDIAEGMAVFGIPNVVVLDIVVGATMVDSVGKVMVGMVVVIGIGLGISIGGIGLGMSIGGINCVGLESDIADGMAVVFDTPNEVLGSDFAQGGTTIVSKDFVGNSLVVAG